MNVNNNDNDRKVNDDHDRNVDDNDGATNDCCFETMQAETNTDDIDSSNIARRGTSYYQNTPYSGTMMSQSPIMVALISTNVVLFHPFYDDNDTTRCGALCEFGTARSGDAVCEPDGPCVQYERIVLTRRVLSDRSYSFWVGELYQHLNQNIYVNTIDIGASQPRNDEIVTIATSSGNGERYEVLMTVIESSNCTSIDVGERCVVGRSNTRIDPCALKRGDLVVRRDGSHYVVGFLHRSLIEPCEANVSLKWTYLELTSTQVSEIKKFASSKDRCRQQSPQRQQRGRSRQLPQRGFDNGDSDTSVDIESESENKYVN